jgi:hypothetical protein
MTQFAIITATFQRTDGKAPFYLKRALDSVFNQLHTDFKMYVIGDKYENNEEFINIVNKYPKEKIYYKNLPYAKERDKYLNKKYILWTCGGINAANHGIDLALKDNFKYICHLDHDDYWSKEHLSSLNEVIEETSADWVCTQSTYLKNANIPKIKTDERYISYLPTPFGLINSSVCLNFLTLPIKYHNIYEEEKRAYPSDADRWKKCALIIKQKRLKSFFINKLTCFYEEGSSTLK